ncbi:hypothetical protein LPW11_00805 [Geomonas sp. RF6]|uniref:hypothetical protein n=1 Tax=Geomonas sp. RF6 TaxID=2897342 RepID=UPI001E2F38D4|nr:hypothetical protein [Geomonas sp. RF6]UFS70744.1 hypothetical protein LPW11_00805 [Geomonas sp. RF6]
MKGTSRIALVVFAVILAGAVPASARGYGHGHGHGHGGASVYIGPVWGPLWWGPTYYYPPPRTVVIERSPEVYVQQAPAPEASQYWYYCQDAKAYYPYVKQCPGGWQTVTPAPPPEEGE